LVSLDDPALMMIMAAAHAVPHEHGSDFLARGAALLHSMPDCSDGAACRALMALQKRFAEV
jgi:hypothetical protein